jgi:hypothetical protein
MMSIERGMVGSYVTTTIGELHPTPNTAHAAGGDSSADIAFGMVVRTFEHSSSWEGAHDHRGPF